MVDDMFSGHDVSYMKEYITVKEIEEYFGEKTMTNEELIKEDAVYKLTEIPSGMENQRLSRIFKCQPPTLESHTYHWPDVFGGALSFSWHEWVLLLFFVLLIYGLLA